VKSAAETSILERPHSFGVLVVRRRTAEAERIFNTLAQNGKIQCLSKRPSGHSALEWWSTSLAFHGSSITASQPEPDAGMNRGRVPSRLMALSRKEFAEVAGVSRQAVEKALKRGWQVADADGWIDPADPTNERHLLPHAKGIDCKGRDMRSHRGPGQSYLATAEGEQKR
jgi:hypothetical protein